MILRSIVTAFVIVLAPEAAAAQDVIAKAGLNFSTDSNPYEDSSQSRRRGLVAGIAVRVPTRDRFSVQFEGLYSEKGHRFGSGGVMPAETGDFTIRYLELPILGRADFGGADAGGRFYLVGGAAPALRLDAKLRIDGPASGKDEEFDWTDEVRKFDLGLTGGVGVEAGRLSIEARYTRGLLTIDADPRYVDTAAITNRTFMMALGYRLR